MKKAAFIVVILGSMLLLAGCAPSNGAGAAVEAYFQAIVSGDAERAAAVSCPDWQETARSEVASFVGVKARLDKLSCKPVNNGSDQTMVACSGAIIATYNDQDSRMDLTGRQFRVVQQNQKWLVCGYGQ